jgi:hypothetical protein
MLLLGFPAWLVGLGVSTLLVLLISAGYGLWRFARE